MNLDHLTDKELVTLGCRIRESQGKGASFGRDAARMQKTAKMAYIRELCPDNKTLEGYVFAMKGALPTESETQAPRIDTHADPLPEGGIKIPLDEIHGQDAREAIKTEAHKVAASVKPSQNGTLTALEKALRDVVGGAVDEDRVNALIDSRIGTLGAEIVEQATKIALEQVPVRVVLGGSMLPKDVECEGKHQDFARVMALCALPAKAPDGTPLRPNIMLVGGAGCGKTTLAGHIAQALGRPFGALSLSAGMTEGPIVGRVFPLGEGRYIPSEFVRMYEGGGVFLFDEMDAGAAEILLVVNAALSNGGMHVEARAISGLSTYIPRHADTLVLAAANTFGTGATAQFVGRAALDGATLDRFLCVYMENDKALEARICGMVPPAQKAWVPTVRSEAQLAKALEVLHAFKSGLEESVKARGLKRIVGPRMLLKGRACLAAGWGWDETKDALLAGWSKDERVSCGVA